MNIDGKSILLIEKDSFCALDIQNKLAGINVRINIVESFEQAIEQVINTGSIDFILIDLNLIAEIKDSKAVKEMLNFRKLPVIVYAAQSQDTVSVQLNDTPIYGIIEKNTNETIFHASICQALTLYDADQKLMQVNNRLNCMLTQIRSFIDNAPAAIAMLDADLRFIEANKVYYQEYNIKSPDVTGLFLYDIFPETPIRWKKTYSDCLNGSEFSSDFDLFFRADGSIDFVKWKVNPWINEDQKIGGIIIFSVVLNKFLTNYQQFESILKNTPALNKQEGS